MGVVLIRVAIRFDDPSPDSQRGLEEGIIDLLGSEGVSATFAIVPFSETHGGSLSLDEVNSAHLLAAQRLGIVEIALHGHSHKRHNSEGFPSEFFGLSLARQTALLSAAAAHLRSLFGAESVHGFVPPWNSYDATTLHATAGLGFYYLSAGNWYPPGYAGPLAILPRTCQFTALESAIAEARRFAGLDPHVVAVLHHYDFRESGEPGANLDLPAFARRLAWLRQQPDVQVMRLDDMVASSRFGALARPFKGLIRKEHLPWRLRLRLPTQCLVDAPLWRQLLA